MPKKKNELVDMNAVNAHLQTVEDMSEDDGYEASNASQALETVRKIFYGTPQEEVLTAAIMICDAVHQRAEELG